MGWFYETLHNQDIMLWVMALLVFLLTQLVKLPIKVFTNKITVEKTRKMVNSTILLIPFALGCLLEFLYDHFVLQCVFDWMTGLILGGQSMAFYGIFDHFFGIKFTNELEECAEGQAVLEAVEEAKADGVVTAEEVKEIAVNTIKGKKSDKKSKKEEKTETPKEVQDFIDNMDLGSK